MAVLGLKKEGHLLTLYFGVDDEHEFPATHEGARDLGRLLTRTGADGWIGSSSLDFPEDDGFTAEEVEALLESISVGMSERRGPPRGLIEASERYERERREAIKDDWRPHLGFVRLWMAFAKELSNFGVIGAPKGALKARWYADGWRMALKMGWHYANIRAMRVAVELGAFTYNDGLTESANAERFASYVAEAGRLFEEEA